VVATTVALAVVGGVIFGISSIVQFRCGRSGCRSGLAGRFDVEAVGGFPRLFTTAVFLLVAVVAVSASRTAGRDRTWWVGVAVAGGLLAVAKIGSAHSAFESSDGRTLTLVVSLALSGAGIWLLAAGARRWGVPGARPVIVALVAYTVAALGLDALTAVVEAVQAHTGLRSRTTLAFVEEFGEALAALALLASVRSARLCGLVEGQS
jgi:hypothetical protein